jgi:hypothetical protein
MRSIKEKGNAVKFHIFAGKIARKKYPTQDTAEVNIVLGITFYRYLFSKQNNARNFGNY